MRLMFAMEKINQQTLISKYKKNFNFFMFQLKGEI